MGFLTMLGGPIISAITGSMFGSVEKIMQGYFNKQISQAEAMAKVQEALVAAFKDVEVAYAQSISNTYASFMGAVKESKVLQYGWLTVVVSQVFVLFVHQIIIPAMAVYDLLPHAWRSGTTIEYAYLLLSVCMGAGAIALKSGSGGAVAAIKGLISK